MEINIKGYIENKDKHLDEIRLIASSEGIIPDGTIKHTSISIYINNIQIEPSPKMRLVGEFTKQFNDAYYPTKERYALKRPNFIPDAVKEANIAVKTSLQLQQSEEVIEEGLISDGKLQVEASVIVIEESRSAATQGEEKSVAPPLRGEKRSVAPSAGRAGQSISEVLDALSDKELQVKARELGIKGAHLYKRENLIKKLISLKVKDNNYDHNNNFSNNNTT